MSKLNIEITSTHVYGDNGRYAVGDIIKLSQEEFDRLPVGAGRVVSGGAKRKAKSKPATVHSTADSKPEVSEAPEAKPEAETAPDASGGLVAQIDSDDGGPVTRRTPDRG